MIADPNMARRMINACVCAYEIHHDEEEAAVSSNILRRVDNGDGCVYDVDAEIQGAVGFVEGPETYAPAFICSGEDHINGCLVGLTEDGYAVVSVRGTLPPELDHHNIMGWVKDWVNDAHMRPLKWILGKAHLGHAERGFAEAAQELWPWVQEQLGLILDQAPNGVLITGHSKGGAMTYLMASLVHQTWPDLEGKIEVYAFAPAVSVDEAFAEGYSASGLAEKTYRFQHENDLVPFLPNWTRASIWKAVSFKGFLHEAEWLALTAFVGSRTGAGYWAPGHLIYFDSNFRYVDDPNPVDRALAAVASALQAGEFKKVGAAHSARDSYLRCFPPAAE
ncbi:Lipase (class 3) [Shimia sp. SK013]|uniref:lipase family protein n=1 Tax=Shimia sp. SK013 TaxID=1389006 RepID=UPI0006CDE793|nr:lipase family protein [Shimia sp. SK013]KPA21807.1 Lipase (class 3) [Shimia sp. SK013]